MWRSSSMHLGVSKRDVSAYDGDTKLNISIYVCTVLSDNVT